MLFVITSAQAPKLVVVVAGNDRAALPIPIDPSGTTVDTMNHPMAAWLGRDSLPTASKRTVSSDSDSSGGADTTTTAPTSDRHLDGNASDDPTDIPTKIDASKTHELPRASSLSTSLLKGVPVSARKGVTAAAKQSFKGSHRVEDMFNSAFNHCDPLNLPELRLQRAETHPIICYESDDDDENALATNIDLRKGYEEVQTQLDLVWRSFLKTRTPERHFMDRKVAPTSHSLKMLSVASSDAVSFST